MTPRSQVYVPTIAGLDRSKIMQFVIFSDSWS